MNRLQYLDFELVIEKAGGQYQARVVRSPIGEASHTFDLPFSDLELENLILRLGATSRSRRRISSSEMQLARQFGTRLFEAVFGGDVRASFLSGQQLAKGQGRGLRLKLRLDAPELINVPWEYLYDGSMGRFLSLFEDTPIVRYIDMRGSFAPLSVTPPLSVLVMLSRPSDYQPLDVEREKANIQSALSELVETGMLTLTFVDKATLPALGDRLLRGRYHVFHYIGHGGFDEQSQDGMLVLEDESGRGRLTSGERMAVLLGNHPTLRLVLLNACEGARTSSSDPFAGTATTLVRTGGVPAVVAMQFSITDEAAITFARGFYTALSVGRPVDAAVSQARLAVFADDNDVEWGTPVLYMRAPDGQIFDVASITAEMRAARQRALEAVRASEEREARLQELYEQAATLLGAKDWEGAQEALARLQEIEPGYRDIASLARQARSGAQKQERADVLFRAADQDLEAGRLQQAISGFRSVLDLDPGHGGASRQLAEAQARLERQEEEERARREAQAELERKEQEERTRREAQAALEHKDQQERARRAEQAWQAELERLFAAGDAAAQAKDWPQAIQAFQALVGLDVDYPDAARRLAEAREALAREEAERRRLAALGERYDRARERMEAQDWPEAERLLRAIQEEAPSGYRDTAALLVQVREERERSELPVPPPTRRPRPVDLPEEIKLRTAPVKDVGEEKAGPQGPPAGRQPRPTDLPEEIERRPKPKDLPT